MGVIDRRRIERLTAALAHADDAAEAAGAIGEIIDRTGKPGYKPAPDAESSRLWASVKPAITSKQDAVRGSPECRSA